jgi:hypothetical protein
MKKNHFFIFGLAMAVVGSPAGAACVAGFTPKYGNSVQDANGTVWQKCSVGQKGFGCAGQAKAMTMKEVREYLVANKDLRLPTYDELIRLACNGRYPNGVFPNTKRGHYWSGTSTTAYNTSWVIDFKSGYDVIHDHGQRNYVRLVRADSLALRQ